MSAAPALTPGTIALLTLPPLLWAGNAVVGRLVADAMPPVTLNFIRWLLAFAILLPLGGWVLRPGSGLWVHWRRFSLMGLLAIALYNALQYQALKTSSALNVTLVGASMPLWMMAVGRLFFGVRPKRMQMLGAVLSMSGVAVVLSRGSWAQLLQLRLVPGDLFMLAATIAWAAYSWLLVRGAGPEALRRDWSAYLLAQVCFGLMWSAAMTAGEWALTPARIDWSAGLLAAIAYIAIGPAILAYRCWGLGVQRAGPALAAFFVNLTPLFAALLSALLLGELPQTYHAAAFALIVGGIIVSSRR